VQAIDVSVALCTCNGARWIEEQVCSIAQQTLPVRELVVRDDASKDDTVDRVRHSWVAAGRREDALRITVNTERLGVARNFEAAMRDCRGAFIALCDQDDRWPRSHLERLWEALRTQPDALLVHSDATLIGPTGDALGLTLFQALGVTQRELAWLQRGRSFEVALDRNLVTGATTLVRRELLEAALPVPAEWLHDEWLGAIAGALGRSCTLTETLLLYRQHGANQIGARRKTLMGEVRRLRASPQEPDRLARARALLERLLQLGERVPPRNVVLAREKVIHHEARAALPPARWKKIVPVLHEVATGRYSRYGRGWRGVLRDLFKAP
jgi:glycosyltransferase involved in cell wall biosynthesis